VLRAPCALTSLQSSCFGRSRPKRFALFPFCQGSQSTQWACPCAISDCCSPWR
jgi:hypothetical protein